MKEYIKLFPDADMGNPSKRLDVRRKISEKKKEWHKKNPDFFRGENNPNYRGLSDKTKRKLSEAMKKRWQDPEYRKSMTGKNHPMYGKRGKKAPRYGKKHSKKTRDKISEKVREWITSHPDFVNPSKRPDVRKKLKANHASKNPEWREKVSKAVTKWYKKNPEQKELRSKLLKENNPILKGIAIPTKPQLELFGIVKKDFPDAELEYPIPEIGRRADIAIPSLKLDVEYDGPYWHDPDEDRNRDEEFHSIGWNVIRIGPDELRSLKKESVGLLDESSGE